ncbi:uncharacterized protein Dvar_01790 [Desulfosarcina variabilis str. Montpellier]
MSVDARQNATGLWTRYATRPDGKPVCRGAVSVFRRLGPLAGQCSLVWNDRVAITGNGCRALN